MTECNNMQRLMERGQHDPVIRRMLNSYYKDSSQWKSLTFFLMELACQLSIAKEEVITEATRQVGQQSPTYVVCNHCAALTKNK